MQSPSSLSSLSGARDRDRANSAARQAALPRDRYPLPVALMRRGRGLEKKAPVSG